MLLGTAGVGLVGDSEGGGCESAREETARAFASNRAFAKSTAVSVTAQR
jgi:hypothetical protein